MGSFFKNEQGGTTWIDILLVLLTYSIPISIAILSLAVIFSDKLLLIILHYGKLGV